VTEESPKEGEGVMSDESVRLLRLLGEEVESAESAGMTVSFVVKVYHDVQDKGAGWAIRVMADRPAPDGEA
jgi:hypothetical protein